MVKKYIVLIISIFLYAGSIFAQNTADDYFEEDDGYTAAHQEMLTNHTAEDASGGYQFTMMICFQSRKISLFRQCLMESMI